MADRYGSQEIMLQDNSQTRAHPFLQTSIFWAALRTLFSRASLAMFRYIFTVLTQFILPQLVARLWPKRYRIVPVDHELDNLIAFEPQRVGVYLSFVGVWCRALGYTWNHFGRACAGDLAHFLDSLSNSYIQARSIYRRCLSTTRRPAKAVNGQFRMMYFFDPHFNCVPSLHIMIVCAVFMEFEDIFLRHDQPAEAARLSAALYRQAVAISESVVFVKQHSINCISAALYMVSNLYPRFDQAAALEFAELLFIDQLPAPERRSILDHVTTLYESFMADSRCGAADYCSVLVDFLDSYQAPAWT